VQLIIAQRLPDPCPLLAVGEFFDAANMALNGDAAEVKVNVRAQEAGCFTVDL